jgi:MYXO-CTERM domain-containing protein
MRASDFQVCPPRSVLGVIGGVGLALLGVSAARADDAYWTGSISGTGTTSSVGVSHPDGGLFKGTLYVTVTNSGLEAWGNFHFQIYDPIGTQDISNVHFVDSTTTPTGPDPTSTQVPFSWTIDNVSVGARCDVSFPASPILPGQTASFTVYTSNADHLSFFGVMIYPTAVPAPAGLSLLALAGFAAGRRRR